MNIPTKKGATPVDAMIVTGLGLVTAGKKVKHPQFGRGTVEELYEWGRGKKTIKVNFKKYGFKSLAPEHSNLKSRYW